MKYLLITITLMFTVNTANAGLFTADDSPTIKLNENNVCLHSMTFDYEEIKTFTGFNSMNECLEEGGEAPHPANRIILNCVMGPEPE